MWLIIVVVVCVYVVPLVARAATTLKRTLNVQRSSHNIVAELRRQERTVGSPHFKRLV
jgi:hypothetical protein